MPFPNGFCLMISGRLPLRLACALQLVIILTGGPRLHVSGVAGAEIDAEATSHGGQGSPVVHLSVCRQRASLSSGTLNNASNLTHSRLSQPPERLVIFLG
jgi:hypothetical protein